MNDTARWQAIVAGGFWRCLVWRGVISWGIPFCLIFGAVRTQLNDPGTYWQHVLSGWPLGLGAGIIWAVGLWGFAQLQLVRARRNQSEED